MITGLDHVAIAVDDWDAAVGHYSQLLGLPVLLSGQRAALFRLSNTRILLLQAAAEAGVVALGLGVADLERCTLQLGAAGIITSRSASASWIEADSVACELGLAQTRSLQLRLVQRTRSALPAANSVAPDRVEALDHVVIRSAAPEQAVALYNAALGIRLALDRELAGTRMLFFRTGGVTLEVIADSKLGAEDSFYGLAYRVRDLVAAHARLTAAGYALTELRAGRKPGTQVFSMRSSTGGVPTLFIRDASRD
jgi:catechol 2,3-dioxygenase-like lactoylglutathione lyase family enzyme